MTTPDPNSAATTANVSPVLRPPVVVTPAKQHTTHRSARARAAAANKRNSSK